jgi:hypothetical protein
VEEKAEKLKKPIIVAAVLFTALLFFYLVFEGDTPDEKAVLQGERFLSLKASDIREIKIVTREGLAFECAKDSGGAWHIVKGEKETTAEEKIDDFLEAMTTLVKIDHFSVNANLLDQYGLREPSAQITLTDLTQKTHDILVGDKTPDASTGVYVMSGNDNRVVILGAVLNWELFKLSSLFTVRVNH